MSCWRLGHGIAVAVFFAFFTFVFAFSACVQTAGLAGRFIGGLRQARRCFAHIKFASHHVGNQAGFVFAQEIDFAVEAGDRCVHWLRFDLKIRKNLPLLFNCWQ